MRWRSYQTISRLKYIHIPQAVYYISEWTPGQVVMRSYMPPPPIQICVLWLFAPFCCADLRVEDCRKSGKCNLLSACSVPS